MKRTRFTEEQVGGVIEEDAPPYLLPFSPLTLAGAVQGPRERPLRLPPRRLRRRLHPKDAELERAAHVVVRDRDLRAVLPYLIDR